MPDSEFFASDLVALRKEPAKIGRIAEVMTRGACFLGSPGSGYEESMPWIAWMDGSKSGERPSDLIKLASQTTNA